MNTKILTLFLLTLFCTPALAAGGKITISSPANGSTVSAKSKVAITYEAALSSDGDHLHLYLDGKRIDVLRALKGSTELDALSSGKHHICLTENTKSHSPTGLESCIDLISQ